MEHKLQKETDLMNFIIEENVLGKQKNSFRFPFLLF